MAVDEIPAEGRQSRQALLFALTTLLLVFLPLQLRSQTIIPVSDAITTGTLVNMHTDKRVVQSGRWFLVREFTVDFAVKDSAVYCGELTTTDATEAHDLMESNGQPVQFAEKGKDLYITLKTGRKIRAHRLSAEKCPRG
jgi:hypothetical protein